MSKSTQKLIEQIKKTENSSKKGRLSQLYHVDLLFKEIIGISKTFPLSRIAHLHHGVPIAFDYVLNKVVTEKPHDLYFVHTLRQEQLTKEKYGVSAYCIGDIFMNYRRHKGWKQQSNAEGTLVFPCHSTNYLDSVADWDRYALELKQMPSKYHPIKVCMYWKDLVKNKHLAFEKQGLEIVSAGHYNDPTFCENLYQLLTSVKYTTSNEVGSYAFYSLDLNIPFFCFGEKAIFEIKNSELTPRNDKDVIDRLNVLENAFRVDPHQEEILITDKQRELFSNYVAYPHQDVDIPKIKKILYRSFLPIIMKKIGHKFFS